MILETYERDDGWRRQIAYHDGGTITFPMGSPPARPRPIGESVESWVKRVFRAHGAETGCAECGKPYGQGDQAVVHQNVKTRVGTSHHKRCKGCGKCDD